MKTVHNHLIVVGSIVERDGKILLVQEKTQVAYGLWNMPAGKLDPKETVKEAAIREVKEETGYDIKIKDILGFYLVTEAMGTDLTVIKIIFRSSVIGGELRVSKDELLDVKWFEPSEILEMDDSKLRGIRDIIEDYVSNKNYSLESIRSRKAK